MSTRICPHCGQAHREGARFCPVTGKAILSPAQPKPPTPSPQSLEEPAALLAGMTGKLPPNAFLNNRFLIVQKIGQGGMAAVYQAADTQQPGTLWAIKEMSDSAITDALDRQYAVQSFRQEAMLLKALSHPNLPKVIDFFTEGGKHYLVMEFIPGKTLYTMLQGRQQPFSEEEVMPWALQLCEVLDYLHGQRPKIIFRDLKPSNIMITPEGQVKLIDFGIVRFFKPGKIKDTLALGTPGYASPEATGGQTDERSDIYSLCVTLHQLLTLHDPCKTLFNIPPARRLNPNLSPEIDRVLTRGMQNQRELRWSGAAEMRVELARIGIGVPKAAVTIPRAEPVRPEPVTPAVMAGQRAPDISKTVIASPPVSPQAAPPARQPAPQVSPPPVAASPPVASPKPAAPTATARPTTRLLMVASHLSGRQLAALGFIILVILVGGSWLLAEPLTDFLFDSGIDPNLIPIIAAFGPLGYAALPRRGMAFLSHVVLSGAFIITTWTRIGLWDYWHENSELYLFLGLLASGFFMEVWLLPLPRLKDAPQSQVWLREVIWLALMAAIGTAIFLVMLTDFEYGFEPLGWFFSAIFGGLGWFIGDLLQQYLVYKRTGLWRDR